MLKLSAFHRINMLYDDYLYCFCVYLSPKNNQMIIYTAKTVANIFKNSET